MFSLPGANFFTISSLDPAFQSIRTSPGDPKRINSYSLRQPKPVIVVEIILSLGILAVIVIPFSCTEPRKFLYVCSSVDQDESGLRLVSLMAEGSPINAFSSHDSAW